VQAKATTDHCIETGSSNTLFGDTTMWTMHVWYMNDRGAMCQDFESICCPDEEIVEVANGILVDLYGHYDYVIGVTTKNHG
jgi:hypothetical protein